MTDVSNGNKASLPLLDSEDVPPFYYELHRGYIIGLASKMATSFEGALTEHLRMSGVYWSLTALSLLLPWSQVDAVMGVTTVATTTNENDNEQEQPQQSILDWLYTCYDERTGGFGGNTDQDGHLLYTLSAIQILALADQLDKPRFMAIRESVVQFMVQLQQPDGSWAGDAWGEIDTRFSYCALSGLAQLQALDRVAPTMLDKAVEYILQCRNLDGGFGCVPGAESHAGQVFTCVGALAIAQALDRLRTDSTGDDDNSNIDSSATATAPSLLDKDEQLLGWWLAERQVDSGGLNGRPEKQADVCYSWWILSSLSILGKVSWINGDKLASYILKCQDEDDGGIADRPNDMADVFHTFFGIAGLSLLGHLHRAKSDAGDATTSAAAFRRIDPIYALPTDVCQRLKLPGQVIATTSESANDGDDRLQHYQQCDGW